MEIREGYLSFNTHHQLDEAVLTVARRGGTLAILNSNNGLRYQQRVQSLVQRIETWRESGESIGERFTMDQGEAVIARYAIEHCVDFEEKYNTNGPNVDTITAEGCLPEIGDYLNPR